MILNPTKTKQRSTIPATKREIYEFHLHGERIRFDADSLAIERVTGESPLPSGEGKGEGESNNPSPQSSPGGRGGYPDGAIYWPAPARPNFQLPPKPGPVKKLVLNVTHDCNLACRYCFASVHERGAAMTAATARKAIEWAFGNNPSPRSSPKGRGSNCRQKSPLPSGEGKGEGSIISVSFFGGEPLMNWLVVLEAIRFAELLAANRGAKAKFHITTNASLLTAGMLGELKNRDCSFLVSIDGPQEIHDYWRPMRTDIHHGDTEVAENGNGGEPQITQITQISETALRQAQDRQTAEEGNGNGKENNGNKFKQINADGDGISDMDGQDKQDSNGSGKRQYQADCKDNGDGIDDQDGQDNNAAEGGNSPLPSGEGQGEGESNNPSPQSSPRGRGSYAAAIAALELLKAHGMSHRVSVRATYPIAEPRMIERLEYLAGLEQQGLIKGFSLEPAFNSEGCAVDPDANEHGETIDHSIPYHAAAVWYVGRREAGGRRPETGNGGTATAINMDGQDGQDNNGNGKTAPAPHLNPLPMGEEATTGGDSPLPMGEEVTDAGASPLPSGEGQGEGSYPNYFYFRKIINRLRERKLTCSECGAGCGYMTVGPDGTIYACHRETGTEIGHVDYGIDESKRAIWLDNRYYVRDGCQKCWARNVCGGGCRQQSASNGMSLREAWKPRCRLMRAIIKECLWIMARTAERREAGDQRPEAGNGGTATANGNGVIDMDGQDRQDRNGGTAKAGDQRPEAGNGGTATANGNGERQRRTATA